MEILAVVWNLRLLRIRIWSLWLYSRRDPESVKLQTEGVKVYPIAEAASHKEEIDVLILCGGSATDLPVQTPELAKNFNVIDSFDTHARIPEHFAAVDQACKEGHTVGIISVGWDPGLFSLNRLYAESILPNGKTYTFWGKGVSQGHSDAIRRVAGVKRGIQYTIPVPEAVEDVRACRNPEAYHQTETYQRMLCRSGGRCRSSEDRGRDQDYAKLLF